MHGFSPWCRHGAGAALAITKGTDSGNLEAGDETEAAGGTAPGSLATACSDCFLFSSVFSLCVGFYAHRGQKWVSDTLELEFETTVRCHVWCLELNPHPLEEQINPQFAFLHNPESPVQGRHHSHGLGPPSAIINHANAHRVVHRKI